MTTSLPTLPPCPRSAPAASRAHRFWALCAAVCLFLLPVCSLRAAEPVAAATKTLPKDYKGTTLNILTGTGPAPDAYVAVTKEFEQATGIRIIFTALSYQEMHQRLILDMASGTNAIDAALFAYEWKPEIAPFAADLKRLSEQVKGAPPLQLDDYPSRALEIYGVMNGITVGLPVLGDAALVLWNTTQYKAAGLNPDSPPATWDDVYTRGVKLMNGSHLFGYGMPAGKSIQSTVTWLLLFNAFGGKPFDDKWKPQLDSAAGQQAMDFMVNKLAKISPSGITTWDFPEMFTAFATAKVGQTMMWPGGLGGLSDPAQSQVAGQFRWSPPPGGALLGGWSYGINKASSHTQAAYLYGAWLTSPEIVKKSALIGGAPVRISAFRDPELVKRYPYYPAILEGMENAFGYPPLKETSEINILIYEAVNAAVSGTKPSAQAVHDLQRAVLDLMTQRGYYR